jgi:hypothetical protein
VARPRGLGKSLAALLAALPPGGRPPGQVAPTPSSADLDSRLNALAEEVRELGTHVEQLLRERRDAGEATTASLLDSALRCHRTLYRAARDRIPCLRRLTSAFRRDEPS